MYWPARNCSRSLAGSCRRSTATSGASRVMEDTRQGHAANREIAGRGHHPRLDGQVGERRGAAHQREAAGGLGIAQRSRMMGSLRHLPVDHARLAGPAGAVLAAIGQDDRVAQRRVENAFAGIGLELLAAGLDGDSEGHEETLGRAIMAR